MLLYFDVGFSKNFGHLESPWSPICGFNFAFCINGDHWGWWSWYVTGSHFLVHPIITSHSGHLSASIVWEVTLVALSRQTMLRVLDAGWGSRHSCLAFLNMLPQVISIASVSFAHCICCLWAWGIPRHTTTFSSNLFSSFLRLQFPLLRWAGFFFFQEFLEVSDPHDTFSLSSVSLVKLLF